MYKKPSIKLNTLEVESILQNRKDIIRRPIVPQPEGSLMRYDGSSWWEMHLGYPFGHGTPLYKGNQIGSKLWVKESWLESNDGTLIYKALNTDKIAAVKWNSPTSMLRKHSRLVIQITDLRIQQLNDITDEDIIREGIDNKEDYIKIWNKYASKEYEWDKNPFTYRMEIYIYILRNKE